MPNIFCCLPSQCTCRSLFPAFGEKDKNKRLVTRLFQRNPRQRRCMTKTRQFLFGPMRPFPWFWDTELEARLGMVIEGVLFGGHF